MSPGKNQKGIACLFEFTWMPNFTIKREPASKFYFRVLDYIDFGFKTIPDTMTFFTPCNKVFVFDTTFPGWILEEIEFLQSRALDKITGFMDRCFACLATNIGSLCNTMCGPRDYVFVVCTVY